MIGPQDSAGRFFSGGVVFGSGDCSNTHLVLERPKVGAELFGWRYENRSRHGFALAPDAELRPSLGQCSNANPCVIKNHASSVFDRAIARQPDGIACLVWDVKAEWRSGDPVAAHARQLSRSQSGLHRSLGVGENQSRRDPAKVAQYEVLGKRF